MLCCLDNLTIRSRHRQWLLTLFLGRMSAVLFKRLGFQMRIPQACRADTFCHRTLMPAKTSTPAPEQLAGVPRSMGVFPWRQIFKIITQNPTCSKLNPEGRKEVQQNRLQINTAMLNKMGMRKYTTRHDYMNG